MNLYYNITYSLRLLDVIFITLKVGNKIVKIPAVRFCYLKTSGCSISDSFKNGYCLTLRSSQSGIIMTEGERDGQRERMMISIGMLRGQRRTEILTSLN